MSQEFLDGRDVGPQAPDGNGHNNIRLQRSKRLMRTASRLSPLQRAYLMGLRRAARIEARCDVNGSKDEFEAMRAQLRCVRREMARLRAIDCALKALLPNARRQRSETTAAATSAR